MQNWRHLEGDEAPVKRYLMTDAYKERTPKTNLRGSQSGGYSCSMCRTDPPNGDSSGTTLGVPFKALLHRHNACRPALRHGRDRETHTYKEPLIIADEGF